MFAIWESNVDTVRTINKHTNRATPRGVIAQNLVAHLKSRAIALSKQGGELAPDSQRSAEPRKIDKSVLTLSEPKRIRSKEHLRFVAQQPCLICGRTPTHAHHVRYAQPRGLSLKVSDEFTVPLCAIHHNHIHTTLKEREWWQQRNIDPLKTAGELWQTSRARLLDEELAHSEGPKPSTNAGALPESREPDVPIAADLDEKSRQ